MNSTCHLPGSVPTAVQRTATVVEQEHLARNTYRLRLHCPEVAARILPGQFFMVRADSLCDPLLARPFALYDIDEDDGRPTGVDFVYIVVGKLTRLMSGWQGGEDVSIWGPLGNGFPVPPEGHLLLIAGGIGQTPFLAVAREALGKRVYGQPARNGPRGISRLTMAYGVRSAAYLAGLDDFGMEGLDLQLATEDGSRGHHGLVTDLLAEAFEGNAPPDAVFCCGPEPMMKAVGELCIRQEVPCWLSLETPMACGFGACFSCVVPVREDDESWDYRRTCVEGPIFRAERLILDD